MCWCVCVRLCVWCSGKEKDGCSDTESLRNSGYNNSSNSSNWHSRQTGNTNKCHSTIFMSLTKVNYTNGPGTPTLFLTQFIYVRQAGLFPKNKKNNKKQKQQQPKRPRPNPDPQQPNLDKWKSVEFLLHFVAVVMTLLLLALSLLLLFVSGCI